MNQSTTGQTFPTVYLSRTLIIKKISASEGRCEIYCSHKEQFIMHILMS